MTTQQQQFGLLYHFNFTLEECHCAEVEVNRLVSVLQAVISVSKAGAIMTALCYISPTSSSMFPQHAQQNAG